MKLHTKLSSKEIIRPFLIILFLSLLYVFDIVSSSPRFNPYDVLEVHRRASPTEIKKAYKNKAKVLHPDRNKHEDAESQFIEVTKAYQLLSDPDRRRQFDNHGITEDSPNFRKSSRDTYARYGRFEDDPFDSMFADFFESSSGSHRRQGRAFRFNFKSGHGGEGFPGRGSGERREGVFHKHTVTSKAFYNTILPKSSDTPYLIMFYADWCFPCMRVEPIWTRLYEELEPVGFGMATVHTEHERELARKFSSYDVPHLIFIMSPDRIVHYKHPQFSAVTILEFIRRKMPYKLVKDIDDSNVDNFLQDFSDNRVKILFFGHTEVIRLRFLTSAYKFRSRVSTGFISLKNPNGNFRKLVSRFNVETSSIQQKDTLLVFHEPTPEFHKPVASVSMKNLGLQSIHDVIKEHQFLNLPRLSSQSIFDSLCPVESSRVRKRLCVTLITSISSPLITSPPHASLHRFIENHGDQISRASKTAGNGDADLAFDNKRVRFNYVWVEKQTGFVQSLIDSFLSSSTTSSSPVHPTDGVKMSSSRSEGGDEDTPSSGADVTSSGGVNRVVVMWRKESKKLKFEWVEGEWNDESETEISKSHKELLKTLNRLLTANEVLPLEAHIEHLMDEHASTWLTRFALRLIEMFDGMRDTIHIRDHILPAISIVGSILLIFGLGYVMNGWVKQEEEEVQAKLGAKGMKVDKKGQVVPELKIHELRAETYNGMVRLIKPGCRTIVLVVDKSSKEKLVPKFYRAAWPYRRNKTLMFGYMYIEKGLSWFKKVLNLTLPEEREININPKNCIGTVLSLNGHRRYFSMFHAKHPEGSRKRIYTANNGAVAGAFMGFDSEMESDGSGTEEGGGEREASYDIEQGSSRRGEKIGNIDDDIGFIRKRGGSAENSELDMDERHLPIFEDQLLDGLDMWFDRLFEGSTFRYHINFWPEFPISPHNFFSSSTRNHSSFGGGQSVGTRGNGIWQDFDAQNTDRLEDDNDEGEHSCNNYDFKKKED